jgi:hypothetical protein
MKLADSLREVVEACASHVDCLMLHGAVMVVVRTS